MSVADVKTPYNHRELRADWRHRFRTRRDDLDHQEKLIRWFEQFARGTQDEDILAQMREEYANNTARVIRIIESQYPIGFFKPSWEQAQVLNAWHPDHGGYQSVCNFTTNRGGKTTGKIIDTLLWIIPNDPEWVIFEEFEDVEGKRAGCDRGNYQVKMRPDFEVWQRTGRLVPPDTDQPPVPACDIWHGCENDVKWVDPILKEYMKWIPKPCIGKRPDGGSAIFKQEKRFETKYGHIITGKTYNADVQSWAGTEIWRLNMDEGFPQDILTEGLLRVRGGGYFHWAYTVAEARNIGARAKVAYECYSGKQELIGKAKFFTGFKMSMIPEWIMTKEKKAGDLARLSKQGEIGKVRMGEVPFALTSPVIFNNYNRERNVLPVDGSDVFLAIRGIFPERWREELGSEGEDLYVRLQKANILRGLDEGLANPTAAVWVALLQTNEMVIFRELEVTGFSVSDRCRAIIERSGNIWDCLRKNLEDPERSTYREKVTPITGMRVRKTLGDSKMFRRDPEKPSDDWTEKYRKAGLTIERANNIGPAQRCDAANDLLRAEAHRRHILHSGENGCRLYVTRDCTKVIERLENYLWAQITQGPNMGAFTDKPEAKDDHTVDAMCYATDNGMRWFDQAAFDVFTRADAASVDAVTGYRGF